jgi:NAD(P)-dependent dehydrogenase (short-subunit alcohol dehydrogenase family)
MNNSEHSEHRVAIITGGSRGLGRALAERLATDGWNVVIDGRDAAVLAAAAEDIRGGSNGIVVTVPGDVADAAHRESVVLAAKSLGSLQLLINNASVLGPSPLPHLADYPLDDLRAVIDVNVFAPLALIQLALPELRRADGTIVDISSDAAVEGYEGWGGYGASKAALDQLSNVLGAEEPNVHVYAFDPGDMRTAMHQEAFPGEDISDRPEPESVVPAVIRLLGERPPNGRYRASEFLSANAQTAVS